MSFSLCTRACALLVAALLAVPAVAQSAPALDHAGTHVLTMAPDGTLACDLATERQIEDFRADDTARRGTVALTALPSLNARVGKFRIILRATDQLLDRPEALLAFRRAAAQWERIIQNEVTTIIDVDYGPERFGSPYDANVLGSASSALAFATGSSGAQAIVSALKRNTSDPQLTALYDGIPTPTPSTASSGDGADLDLNRGIGGLIPLQILGFRGARLDPEDFPFGTVPNIGFNSAFPYDFDPTDGIDSDKTDFEAVVLHEIGHALGFTSAIGLSSGSADPLFTPWDLFRVRPEAVTPGESLTDGVGFETAARVVTPGPANTVVLVVENGVTYYRPVQVFFDGLAEVETSTATGSRQGGDGQQASHWRDDALRPPSLGADRKIGIMDPNLGRGSRDELTDADLRVLEVIGYTIDYTPVEATIALSVGGQAIDDRFLVEEIALGDGPTGARSVPVVIGNADSGDALAFEATVFLDASFPEAASVTASLSQTEGTIAASGNQTLQLQIDTSAPSYALGRIRVQSNDPDRSVIEVPFTFSAGGVTEPALAISGAVPDDLGDIDLGGAQDATLTLQNTGSLDLDYQVVASVAAANLPLTSGLPEGRQRAPLFTATFEDTGDLAAFDYDTQAAPDRWRTRTDGRATLPGHSASTALYYGANGGSEYNNDTFGQIELPPLDLSGLDPSDRVSFSFAHYLDAEAGFDFASVLVSYDRGETYEALATSDGGILQNTDAWETVVIEVPGVAGFPTPIRFAFRFESDASVTEEGWYLDDIVVEATDGKGGFFASPLAGTIAGNGSVDVTVTANGDALDRGFYRALVEVRTNQRRDDPDPFPIAFTVGAPAFPTVETADPAQVLQAEVGLQTPGDVLVRNGGDAVLSYVRVLEPAARAFEPTATRLATPADLVKPTDIGSPTESASAATSPEARTRPDGDVLGSLEFTTAARLYDLAQYPDGRVLAADGADGDEAKIYVLPEDLSGAVPTPFTADVGGQVVGLAYNSRTESLWLAVFQTGIVHEVTLADGAIALTGRAFGLGFSPFGMTYSPELDAFLFGAYQTSAVLALDAEGNLLPGYPVFVDGRDIEGGATSLPGVTFTEGLLETTGFQDQILQRGQFGRGFGGEATAGVASDVLNGAPGIHGIVRDKRDPNGSFYVATRATDAVPARVVRYDPVDLQDGIGTRLDARAPLFADRSIDPRADFTLPVTVDGRDLSLGSYTEDLVVLTNDPTDPLVRIPVTVSVNPVAAEDGVPRAFRLDGVRPNPLRADGAVQFSLSMPADVTVSVYDALGRRVAVLAERAPLATGEHTLPFPTRSLAPGVYVVRLEAGETTGTQKVTVVR